jgi:hypothetical protein
MLLIDMRKEAFWLHRGRRQVLRLGQRLHERSNIRHHREISRGPERLQTRQRGMQPELGRTAGDGQW